MALRINELDPAERVRRLNALGSMIGVFDQPNQQAASQPPYMPTEQTPGPAPANPGQPAPTTPETPAPTPQPTAPGVTTGGGGLKLDLAPLITQYVQMVSGAGSDRAGIGEAKKMFNESVKSLVDGFRANLKSYIQGVMDRDGNGVPDAQEGTQKAGLQTQLNSINAASRLGQRARVSQVGSARTGDAVTGQRVLQNPINF